MYVAVNRWIWTENCWAELAPKVADDHRIEIRYEDLVNRPEPVLTHLCDFIGVPYNPAMLSYPDRSSYRPPTSALAEQWRTKLSRREIVQAEARIADMLVERGYELSGYPREKITPLRDRLYHLHSRYRKLLFDRRRFGLRFILARAISNRIGPESWRRAVRECAVREWDRSIVMKDIK
jgi:hypothetical protein